MATRETQQRNTRVGRRPVPEEANLEPSRRREARGSDAGAWASGLNVIAGIWLVISPWILNYAGSDPVWNPVIFGAAAAVIGLARIAAGEKASWLSLANMAIGGWIFASAFWLADSSSARWNDIIVGAVVFLLGAWSLGAGAEAGPARRG